VPADLVGGVVEAAAGQYHSMALLADGSVRVWGGDAQGSQVMELCRHSLHNGRSSEILYCFSASLRLFINTVLHFGTCASLLERHEPGLESRQSLLATFQDVNIRMYGQRGSIEIMLQSERHLQVKQMPSEIKAGSYNFVGARAIAAGYQHCSAILRNGSLVAWGGDNAFKELFIPPEVAARNATTISACASFWFASMDNGELHMIGGAPVEDNITMPIDVVQGTVKQAWAAPAGLLKLL
jgi:alpha-tubulin suppressor-like RCC1 family protein